MLRVLLLTLLFSLSTPEARQVQPTCPAPVTSLMRRDNGRCSTDSIPPPLTPPPPPTTQEEKLPSFEEWRQHHVEEVPLPVPRREGEATTPAAASTTRTTEGASPEPTEKTAKPVQAAPAPEPGPPTSLVTTSYIHPQPHAGSLPEDPLTPLKSRTNYASNDCAAVVLQASKSSKHSSTILNYAKDRYMLTPCNAASKFVVVELCEEIDIDTVVLANWEFFSSMFKLFRASVSEVYPGREEDWRELGTFRAGNLRGSQVFRPPHLGGFYRYIRIDFLTHYGTEYYCPVSLLQIYGRTQMEAYREEERAKEELARRMKKLDEEERSAEVREEAVEEPVRGGDVSSEVEMSTATVAMTEATATISVIDALSGESEAEVATSKTSEASMTGSSEETATRMAPGPSPPSASNSTSDEAPTTTSSASASRHSTASVQAATNATDAARSSSSLASVSPSSSIASASSFSSESAASSPRSSPARSAAESQHTSRPARNETRSPPPIPHAPSRESGESIYGTIMKRLSAIEYNGTLSMRYLDDQRRVVSSSIARLERQIAASDAARQQDSQLIRRLILDLDLHRAKIEEERRALAAQVTVLANEIVFERRLGLAQLLALLIVLGFVVLTRGSQATLIRPLTQRSRPYGTLPGRDELARRTLGAQSASRRLHTSLGASEKPSDRTLGVNVNRVPSWRRRQNASAGASTSATTTHTPRIRPSLHLPPILNGMNGHHHDRRRAKSSTPPLSAPLPISAKIPPSPLSDPDRWQSTSGSESEGELSPISTPVTAKEAQLPSPPPSPSTTPTLLRAFAAHDGA